jgi:hypothetical protein
MPNISSIFLLHGLLVIAQIAEFDSPWNLIRKESGIFRTMCLKSGTFSELEAIARGKAENNSSP